MLKKSIKKILFVAEVLGSINWLKLYSMHNKNSNNVLFLVPNGKFEFRKFFRVVDYLNEFALVNSAMECLDNFAIVFGKKNALKLENKRVFFNLSRHFGDPNSHDYTKPLHDFVSHLENKNELIPDLENLSFWENKIFMHEKFIQLDVSHPKTHIVNEKNPSPDPQSLKYPLLFKPAHAAGSMGIEKINSSEELQTLLSKTKYQEYLLQDWMDIRRDLRLIYIGDQLVCHYWRINNSSEWRPTSTSYGSSADFINLPEKWMDFIFKEYKKLNIKTGAFDVTWDKDDMNNKPMILEVSPSYMPNPKPVGKYINLPYSDYKKSIWGKGAYHKEYIKLVFNLKTLLLKEYLT